MPPINPSKLVQRRNPTRPVNGAALSELHALYDVLKRHEGRPQYPWTAPSALALGRLYMQAWGQVPTPARMLATWSLPQYDTIIRLFGSCEAYQAQLCTGDEA